MSGKTTQNTENTSVQDAAASMLSTGNAVANQVHEGADQAQELKERIDSKVANTNETLSEGSAAVANALTFKSYTDGNTPLKAKKVDDEWVTTQEVANVKLRQGTFSKFIREGDVTMTEKVVSTKDLGPVSFGEGKEGYKSGKGDVENSDTVKNRYELGKNEDGNLNAALDQIDISDGEGLLSNAVRFKSWLGVDDSTFLTFIKKVEDFNNLVNIEAKKVAYENVIKQGYAWLAAFPNLNTKDNKAQKKRDIIHKIISGSFSNFGTVELRYLAFEDAYKSFTADSSIDILSLSGFNGIDAFQKLRAFLKEKDIWKKKHNSPVKNRMHSEEKEAMEKIENLGTLEVKPSGEFNIIPGVLKISNPTLKLENLGKKITITSGISLAAGVNIEAAQLSATGKFTIVINDFQELTTTLDNGEVTGSFLSQEFIIKGLKYSTNSPEKISANTAVWKGEILSKVVSITFDNPSISHAEGFVFTKAVGTLDKLTLGSFVDVQNIEILVLREGKDQYDITGTSNSSLEAGIPGLADAKLEGKFTLNRNANKIFHAKIEDGKLEGTILKQKLTLIGLEYVVLSGKKPSPPPENKNEISAKKATLDLTVFGKELSPKIEGAKINENGFDFDSATLPVKFNHSVGPLTITATELMVINNGAGDYDVKAEGGVDLKTDGKNFGIDGKILGGINYNLKTKKTTKYIKKAKAKAEIANMINIGNCGTAYHTAFY